MHCVMPSAEVAAAIECPGFRATCSLQENETVRLSIEDVIGDDYAGGMTAAGVRNFLAEHANKQIDLRINSGGGYVFEAVSILNQLREHQGRVIATVESLAFSAATIVLMGADETQIYENASYGIHRSATVTIGNSVVHRAAGEWLDMIDEMLIAGYMEKTGKPRDWIIEAMDGTADGSVWNGKDAVEHGFIDRLAMPAKKAKPANEAKAKAVASHAMAMNRIKAIKAFSA